jgi:hypothetical protein
MLSRVGSAQLRSQLDRGHEAQSREQSRSGSRIMHYKKAAVERALKSDQREADFKRRAVAVEQEKTLKQRRDMQKARAADRMLGLVPGGIKLASLAPKRPPSRQSLSARRPSPLAPAPLPKRMAPRTARRGTGEFHGMEDSTKLNIAPSPYSSAFPPSPYSSAPRKEVHDQISSSSRRAPRRFPT